MFSFLPVAVLSAPEPASGVIVDRDGQAIGKAEIHFYVENAREVGHGRSDKNGRFSIDVTDAPETWSVAAKGLESRSMR